MATILREPSEPEPQFESANIDAFLVAAADDNRSLYGVLEIYDPNGPNDTGPLPAVPDPPLVPPTWSPPLHPGISAITAEISPETLDQAALLTDVIDHVNNLKLRLRELIAALG